MALSMPERLKWSWLPLVLVVACHLFGAKPSTEQILMVDSYEEIWVIWIKTQTAPSREAPDSKVHGTNMGPTWVLSAQLGPILAHEPCYQGGH